jgi:calcium/calmodulin-dependent protein kinase (CaM kinase) II
VIEYYEAQAKKTAQGGAGIRVARIPGQLERDAVFARIKAAVDPLIEREVLGLTERLLNSIAAGDWATYEELCAPDMTCFEPEARGHLVEGLVRSVPWLRGLCLSVT